MHSWNDRWFKEYGRDLSEAMSYVTNYVRRWSLCRLCCKEKYGCIRYEWILPPLTSLVQSNRLRLSVPFIRKNTKYGRIRIILFDWNNCLLSRLWAKFGWIICYKAVRNAIKIWPHLQDELLSDLASQEWLVGEKLHSKYWISLKNENNS